MTPLLFLVFQFSQNASPIETLFLNVLHKRSQETNLQSAKARKSSWSSKSSKESYFYLMYSKCVFTYGRNLGWPRSKPHRRAHHWIGLGGGERGTVECSVSCSHKGAVTSLPSILPALWGSCSAARAWWWRLLGRGSWGLVAMELHTSELRGFGGLDGGLQNPGSCWRPQSCHRFVQYLWQNLLFWPTLLCPQEPRQPCCWGWGPFPTAKHCASLTSSGLLCCLIHRACDHSFPRSCWFCLRMATFLLDGNEMRPPVPSLPGPCRLVLPECGL